MTLAALGLFVFEAATFPFSGLTRRSGWQHATSERVGTRNASQYTGPGNDEVSIEGALIPEAQSGSYGAIATLRSMADDGERYPLVDGAGNVWGDFVIVSINVGRHNLLVDGTPRMVDFSIELERVG